MELKVNTLTANNRYTPIAKQPNLFGLKMAQPLSRDTVSFGETDLMKRSPKAILRAVQESIKPENRLGSGGEAVVYRIPNTDYCFRYWHFDKGQPITNISFNITEQDKINYHVAKIGEGSSIKKFIEGRAVAMPYTPLEEQREIAEEIANMPVSAFQKLLHQISYAYEHDMMFDCANGNIIVNPKTQTLTVIDFYAAEEDKLALSPLCSLYEALKNGETTTSQKQTIAGKLLLAALEENTPDTKACIAPGDFGFTNFIHKLFNTDVIEDAKYRVIFIKTFENIKKLKQKELQGIPDSISLNGQHKVAQSLIKQLLHISH